MLALFVEVLLGTTVLANLVFVTWVLSLLLIVLQIAVAVITIWNEFPRNRRHKRLSHSKNYHEE